MTLFINSAIAHHRKTALLVMLFAILMIGVWSGQRTGVTRITAQSQKHYNRLHLKASTTQNTGYVVHCSTTRTHLARPLYCSDLAQQLHPDQGTYGDLLMRQLHYVQYARDPHTPRRRKSFREEKTEIVENQQGLSDNPSFVQRPRRLGHKQATPVLLDKSHPFEIHLCKKPSAVNDHTILLVTKDDKPDGARIRIFAFRSNTPDKCVEKLFVYDNQVTIKIGRSSQINQIQVKGSGVSRNHVTLNLKDVHSPETRVELIDTSSNGTWIAPPNEDTRPTNRITRKSGNTTIISGKPNPVINAQIEHERLKILIQNIMQRSDGLQSAWPEIDILIREEMKRINFNVQLKQPDWKKQLEYDFQAVKTKFVSVLQDPDLVKGYRHLCHHLMTKLGHEYNGSYLTPWIWALEQFGDVVLELRAYNINLVLRLAMWDKDTLPGYKKVMEKKVAQVYRSFKKMPYRWLAKIGDTALNENGYLSFVICDHSDNHPYGEYGILRRGKRGNSLMVNFDMVKSGTSIINGDSPDQGGFAPMSGPSTRPANIDRVISHEIIHFMHQWLRQLALRSFIKILRLSKADYVPLAYLGQSRIIRDAFRVDIAKRLEERLSWIEQSELAKYRETHGRNKISHEEMQEIQRQAESHVWPLLREVCETFGEGDRTPFYAPGEPVSWILTGAKEVLDALTKIHNSRQQALQAIEQIIAIARQNLLRSLDTVFVHTGDQKGDNHIEGIYEIYDMEQADSRDAKESWHTLYGDENGKILEQGGQHRYTEERAIANGHQELHDLKDYKKDGIVITLFTQRYQQLLAESNLFPWKTYQEYMERLIAKDISVADVHIISPHDKNATVVELNLHLNKFLLKAGINPSWQARYELVCGLVNKTSAYQLLGIDQSEQDDLHKTDSPLTRKISKSA